VLDYIIDIIYFRIKLLIHNWDVSPENPTLKNGRSDILLDCVTAWVVRVLVDYKKMYIKVHT